MDLRKAVQPPSCKALEALMSRYKRDPRSHTGRCPMPVPRERGEGSYLFRMLD